MRRYNENMKRYKDNKEFSLNQRAFFRNLGREGEMGNETAADPKAMHAFWSNIWSTPKEHKNEYWVRDEIDRVQNLPEMRATEITAVHIENVVRSLGNWRAPGADKIQAYWWKYFTSTHSVLANQFHELIENPTISPAFFTQGITYMLPKNSGIHDPKNFRPITCLPVVYKIFTSLIEKDIARHLHANNVLAREQNGSRKGSRGCTEWLVIDSVVARQASKSKRNISIAWIDYKKAFDSVPHSWLLKVMEIYKIDPSLINVLKSLMQTWRTSLTVHLPSSRYTTDAVHIRRGIFQGDSLSPLWFCMAVNPLSQMLESSDYGYIIRKSPTLKLSHLLYMDDLKLYASGPEQLQGQLELVSAFSKAIHMEFGIDKCAFIHCKKGVIQDSEEITLTDQSRFSPLAEGSTYKYLGIEQALKTDGSSMKKKVENAFLKRLNAVLKTQLYSKNKITAINLWVAPIVWHTFGVLRWTHTDLDNLDRKVRTALTKHRMHHPHASCIRLYLPRNRGGRGLISLVTAHEERLKQLRQYFEQVGGPLHNTIKRIDKNLSALNLASHDQPIEGAGVNGVNEMVEEWKGKVLHGRYPANLYGPETDIQLSMRYLTDGILRPETEGFIISIQDQQVPTRNFVKFILKEDIPDDRCRMCGVAPETVQHISSACTVLAPRQYLDRHNRVAGILHQDICRREELLTKEEPFYKYLPDRILENDEVRVYWDTDIITDKAVIHNRPDILVLYKKKKKAFIVDVTIPLDENIRNSRAEKIAKYQELADEIKGIYMLESVSVIPVILTCNGLVDKTLVKNLERLGVTRPESIVAIMQRSVILSTCSIVRRVLAQN